MGDVSAQQSRIQGKTRLPGSRVHCPLTQLCHLGKVNLRLPFLLCKNFMELW